MSKAEEEWQSTDSGYLNCIGVGDTYVRKQMERILSNNYLKAQQIYWWPTDKNDSFLRCWCCSRRFVYYDPIYF